MKKSQHLRDILGYEYPRDFSNSDRIILSTDQERSNIYVYQSQVVTGHNTIEIYNYENNIDYSYKLASLPKRHNYKLSKLPLIIQEVKQDEEVYGKRPTSRKAQEDSSCYYMNGQYVDIVSSQHVIKTQALGALDDTVHVTHALPKSEIKHFMIVEGKNGSYHNIRIKDDHVMEQVDLQMYYRTKMWYVFIFCLVNENEKFNRKQTYFILRKSLKEIEDMGGDNHAALITMD